ncbi:ribosome maturation factor RimM [Aristophania vespae]|uniref:ribosome maturation factor RimM n=1 Tax=Aristophania vespae TaxID=2697033 RepID=UPI002351665C|nr:ribosome maturation factor RimM [Aristophania vespae]UMM63482.1 Ribosome maturation factor RimM [Aristophania vespae]
MTRSASDQKIHIATIGRPHGVKGLVRLHSLTETPSLLEELDHLFDDQGQKWHVRWVSPNIAALTDGQGQALSDRTMAEKFVNKRLYILRSSLPVTEEEDFYHIDLIGLKALSPKGDSLGTVTIVHDYGAGTSLELDSGFIIPFTRACVPTIDLEKKEVVIILPDEVEVEGDLDGEVKIRA